MSRIGRILMSAKVVVLLASTTGCAQLRTTMPPMQRVAEVATEAAKEPATWIPFAAALLIGVTGQDDEIVDWASDETPIFGSQNSAGDFSDDVKNALIVGMALSSVFAPTPVEDKDFLYRRVATNALAFGTIASVVEVGKLTVRRERPNARDNKSFPSGHSSGSFSSALLIEQNFNATVEKPWLRRTIKFGAYGSAAAVAWARVEANEHHPVDVLFSAGLSNLLVKTFYKTIGPSTGQPVVPPVAIEAHREGCVLKLNYVF